MPIYINKNGQQSGPYEEHVVIDQLRNGMLSPNDMGIRHGEASWQRLGDMFPNVAATPSSPPVSAAPSPSPAVAQFASPGRTPKPAGGCRKPLGWTILSIGLLFMFGGGLVAVATPFAYSTISCDLAEMDYKKVEELSKKHEAAKDTDEEIEIKLELESAMAGYDTSSKYCANENATKRMFQIGGIAVGVVGFFMLIIGFFIRRV